MNLQATSEVIESVHNLLINKVSNARCNEFLRTVTKLACIDKGKGIDGNVSLRDELKVCALKKMSDDDTICRLNVLYSFLFGQGKVVLMYLMMMMLHVPLSVYMGHFLLLLLFRVFFLQKQ